MRAHPAGPVEPAAGGVRVTVRVTPKASRTAVLGLSTGADGRRQVRVSVAAPPEDGKANAALIAFLAKAWRIPKGRIALVMGGADRLKVLFVSGDVEALSGLLAAWIDALPPGE